MKVENIEDIYKLSPTQQGLLFHILYDPNSSMYCNQYRIAFKGNLNTLAFEEAWQQAAARHSVLRTSFFWEEVEEPMQVVYRQAKLPLEQHDWREINATEQKQKLEAFLEADRDRGYQLSEPPLMRLALIQMTDEVYQFIWSNHHIIFDGWSRFVLFNEVLEIYQALNNGDRKILKPSFPYRKYITWLRQQNISEAESFWRKTLQGITAPTPLGIDKSIANVSSIEEYSEQQIELSKAKTEKLKSVAQKYRLTLNTLIQGAWALLLSRYSGEDDVIFGASTSGRPVDLPGIESAVGLFVNSLPVRVQIDAYDSSISWLKKLQAQQAEARQYEHSPLVQIQGWSELAKGVPLFNSLMAFENYPINPELRQRNKYLEICDFSVFNRTNYPLSVIVVLDGQLLLNIIYDRRYFDSDTIARMLGHLQTLLEGMVANPEGQLKNLPLLTESEKNLGLVKWNQTQTDYPLHLCLHQLIEAQVEKTPNAVAVIFADQKLTYQELDNRANQIAHYLQKLGVKPEVRVGICVERSLEMLVGLLGILKAGGAYVPIDPEYPQHRQAFMLQDCQTDVLLTQQKFAATLPTQQAQVICLDTDWEIISREPKNHVITNVTSDNLAYVIYTSGSTGMPKGAMNTHAGVCNRLLWMQDTYELTAGDRVLQKTPFSFDVSVWEFFLPLITGACLVVAQPGGHRDSNYLLKLIAREQITTLHFVPSMLRIFLQERELEQCSSLRQVFCSGEALSFDLQQNFFERLQGKLYNLYGPTEAAIDVTAWTCQRNSQEAIVPIGSPIANIQVYILDTQLRLVPVGVPGELHIGGIGLARGYFNRPELTAEKFIPDPFSDRLGARLYKTGDLACYQKNGTIEFLGRIDYQIKLRGLRIELGEIEAVLGQHPAVQQNIVVAREDELKNQRLVAYLVQNSRSANNLVPQLRSYLEEKLPDFMVPTAFVILKELPLTSNGKVDRKALPEPDKLSSLSTENFVAPRTTIEAQLAEIWLQVLGLERVGIYDNFFELGGDSILSIQAIAKAKQADLQLTPKDLFDYPTIAQLAAVVSTNSIQPTEQGIVTGAVPLTPIQHWFFAQELQDSHHWNQSVLLKLRQKLEPTFLVKAVQQLLTHHDALRLRFENIASGWQQINTAPDEIIPFSHIDLSTIPASDRLSAMETSVTQLQASLNLKKGPILKVTLFDYGAEQPSYLSIVIHHLAVDGVSWRILLTDLQTAYQQLSEGELISLPAKTTSFQNWADRLQEYAQLSEFKQQINYWLTTLQQPVSPLPVDYTDGNNIVDSACTATISLTVEETQALLQQVPKVYNTQINDVLLTALLQAFGQWTGAYSLLVDLEGHGREMLFADVDLSRTVGWFTSLFPVYLDLGASVEPGEALKIVKEQLRQIPNNGIGYGIIRYLNDRPEIQEKVAALPKAEVLFNYLGQLDATLTELSMFELVPNANDNTRSLRDKRSHLLTVNGFVNENKLQLSWTYSTAVHQRSTIEKLAQTFLSALRSLIAHCQLPTAGGYTPSDFPLVKLDRATLDRLIGSDYRRFENIYPLSPIQQGLLFHTLYAPESQMYFEQWSFSLHGKLNLVALQQAWKQAIELHTVLRTAFNWQNLDEPVQIVYRQVELPWQQYDWRGLSPSDREQQLEKFKISDRQSNFNLAVAPGFRLTLIQVADDNYYFIWSHHHILIDGWAAALLLKKVFELYQAFSRGEKLNFPSTATYHNYIAWLQKQNMQPVEAFWRLKLQGLTAPTPVLPKYQTTNPDDSYRLQEFRLPTTNSNALQTLARQHQITLNTFIQGIWALLLSHHSGERDIVFGSTVSGRPATLEGAESIVGLFINTLPVRVKLTADELLLSWLQQMQNQQAEARQYEHSSLVQVHKWSDIPQHLPLFESIVVFQNYPLSPSLRQGFTDLKIGNVNTTVSRNNYPLTLRVRIQAEWLLQILYSGDRFEATIISQLFRQIELLLSKIIEQPATKLSELLAILAEDEKQQQQQQEQELATASLQKLKFAKRKAILG
jgi:amino acid adenylation domain-containing protein/non-ribosomal peptide synthase protein (TIGR01720 family)